MDDSLLSTDRSEGAATLIKKELDERLTEEQRRKKQVIYVHASLINAQRMLAIPSRMSGQRSQTKLHWIIKTWSLRF